MAGLVFLEGNEDDLMALGSKLIDQDVKAIAWEYVDQNTSKMGTMELFELFQNLIHEGINYKLQILKEGKQIK